MGRLNGKTAYITGAARGLGLAMAQTMAKEGAALILTDILVQQGIEAVEKLTAQGARATFLEQNVTDEARWDAIWNDMHAHGPVTIMVNNAGVGHFGSIEQCSFAEWKHTMAVNLDSVFLGMRAAIRHMKMHGGGSIINIASIKGIIGDGQLPAYNASKGGVRLLTKSAALHCQQQGYDIRVNSVHPGYVPTPMVDDALAQIDDSMKQAIVDAIPMGRLGTAEEVAQAVLYLASDESSYCTGSELIIDGGATCQ